MSIKEITFANIRKECGNQNSGNPDAAFTAGHFIWPACPVASREIRVLQISPAQWIYWKIYFPLLEKWINKQIDWEDT